MYHSVLSQLSLFYLGNRSTLSLLCCVIIHSLEVSCKEDQSTSAQGEWFIFVQLTDKLWIITQQITHYSWPISILTNNKRQNYIWSLQLLPTFPLLYWRNPVISLTVSQTFTCICYVFHALKCFTVYSHYWHRFWSLFSGKWRQSSAHFQNCDFVVSYNTIC